MPEPVYVNLVTASSKLFPNNIQPDSGLTSNTSLEVLCISLIKGLHTKHARLNYSLLHSETWCISKFIPGFVRSGEQSTSGSTNLRTGTSPRRWGKAGSNHRTEVFQRAALHRAKRAATVYSAGLTCGDSAVSHLEVVHSETLMH